MTRRLPKLDEDLDNNMSITYGPNASNRTTHFVNGDGSTRHLTDNYYFPSSPILHSPAVIYGMRITG